MLIRAGASFGFVDGEARRGLQGRFAATCPGLPQPESRGGSAAGDLSPDEFPGRWNRRRAIAPELVPLPRVAADALESAGWWRRGSGETCRGGLVVANDTAPVLASLDFTREIHSGPGTLVRPAGFLGALPSTAASVLGLLFGLTEYQACVVSGRLSGVQALRHALDLIELRRLDRVLVASLSVLGRLDRPRVRLAAALCLETGGGGAARGPALDCGVVPARETGARAQSSTGDPMVATLARELPPGALGLASLPLLLVAKYCEKWFSGADPVPLVYHQEEPLTGGQASITLT